MPDLSRWCLTKVLHFSSLVDLMGMASHLHSAERCCEIGELQPILQSDKSCKPQSPYAATDSWHYCSAAISTCLPVSTTVASGRLCVTAAVHQNSQMSVRCHTVPALQVGQSNSAVNQRSAKTSFVIALPTHAKQNSINPWNEDICYKKATLILAKLLYWRLLLSTSFAISQLLHLTSVCWIECKMRLNPITRFDCFNHEIICATLHWHPPSLPVISKAPDISLDDYAPGPCATFRGFLKGRKIKYSSRIHLFGNQK